MSLRETLSNYWYAFQQELFPRLETEFGPLSGRYQLFVATVEFVRLETLLPSMCSLPGRPPQDRAALARAFMAKAVFDIATTRALIERLQVDRTLHRLCGFSSASRLPSEATFSRGFAEFADSALASRLHEALVTRTMSGHLVGHISRDATSIAGREKPLPKAPGARRTKHRRGRPRKGEQRSKELPRLQRQLAMTLPQMLDELPKPCDVGVRTNARGVLEKWVGYKLHVDAADGGVPVSCILTSASLHDSQAAIPLARLTAGRVSNLYDLMDAAYDAEEIRTHSRDLGHVPIIDSNPRGSGQRREAIRCEAAARRALGYVFPEQRRYHERTTVERVYARLKEEFGGRHVRVRGHAKVLCHLMFGILALAVSQLMRLLPPP